MKFWLCDMEKEFLFLTSSKKVIMLGLLGYISMLVFFFVFIIKVANNSINFQLMIICYFGIMFILLIGTFCKIRKTINSTLIIPNILSKDKMEIAMPENDRVSSNKNYQNIENKNKITLKIFGGVFLTIFTLLTHSFMYFYIIISNIPNHYHIILMVNMSFPVTIILIILSIISANVIYNIWVDSSFASDYLIKGKFFQILMKMYVIIGLLFLLFEIISALFSSFCGIFSNDKSSIIVFAILISIIFIPLIVKFIQNIFQKLLKELSSKNN